MMLPALAILVGLLAGIASGGRPGALARPSFRAPAIVTAAVIVQVALGLVPTGARFPLVVASYAAVGVWLVLNAVGRPPVLRAAIVVVAVGWAVNLAAIVPNGGMPVSGPALATAGLPSDTRVEEGHLFKHVPATSDSVLRPLGDVIPVRPFRAVISIGDIALFAGLAMTVAAATRAGDRG